MLIHLKRELISFFKLPWTNISGVCKKLSHCDFCWLIILTQVNFSLEIFICNKYQKCWISTIYYSFLSNRIFRGGSFELNPKILPIIFMDSLKQPFIGSERFSATLSFETTITKSLWNTWSSM